VHWNSAERSWDCPCHGSRFDTDGAVLHGPAATALEALELSAPDPDHTQSAAARQDQPRKDSGSH
jgi:Rieske Fe-S protein